jgi:hypothetical protein
LNYSYDNGTFTEFGASPTYLNYTNATAGFYNYTWNTSGDTNYTPASLNLAYNIVKAVPAINLSIPANFIYDGDGGIINYSISSISNQDIAYISYTITDNNNNLFTFSNVSNSTTSNSYITDPRSGLFNITLFAPVTQNYTSAFANGTFRILQANGNIILNLNNSESNYTIYQHQSIPISASSSITDGNSFLISILLNGTIINQTNLNSTSISVQPNITGLQNYTAILNDSNNYTSANSTWFLNVIQPYSNIELIPTYQYIFPNQTLNTTGTNPNIFDLLNYSYVINFATVYNLTNITINFGNNATFNQTLANTNASGNLTVYNIYLNNSLDTNNISISWTDIYNDTNLSTFNVNLTPYTNVIAAPFILNNSINQTYTQILFNTTFITANINDLFPISSVTYSFGDGNNSTSSSFLNYHNYIYPGTYNVSVFDTDINGITSQTNYTIITVYNITIPTALLLTELAYTANQPYIFLLNDSGNGETLNNIKINWGDNSTTNCNLIIDACYYTGSEVTIYHNYTNASSYNLGVSGTMSNNITYPQILTNPNLNVSIFNSPKIISVLPNNPSNGANSLTNTYSFNLLPGSFSLSNITIYWGNSISNINLTNDNTSVLINHTFEYYNVYNINVNICDIYNNCYLQAFPIQIGYPLGANNTYNNLTDNQTLAEENANSINTEIAQNPTPYLFISFVIIILFIAIGIILYRRRKNA